MSAPTKAHNPAPTTLLHSEPTTTPVRRDVILAMQEPYMQQIATGAKTHEFRKYRIDSSVERVWFYRTAPHSSIEYICEISPAQTREPGDEPLEEGGLGNKEFNEGHKDWEGYDYAYKILSVRQLDKPITLEKMKSVFRMSAAPRELVYTPQTMLDGVKWEKAQKIL